MSEELKPCPFCGGEAMAFRCEESGTFDVQCQQCGAIPFIGSRTSEKKTMADVIAAWNARAAVTDEQFSLAVHDGLVWQVVRECHIRYHGGMVSEGGMEAEDWYYCDACGEELPKWAQDAWDEYEACDFVGATPIRHCPNCGAKIEGGSR